MPRLKGLLGGGRADAKGLLLLGEVAKKMSLEKLKKLKRKLKTYKLAPC